MASTSRSHAGLHGITIRQIPAEIRYDIYTENPTIDHHRTFGMVLHPEAPSPPGTTPPACSGVTGLLRFSQQLALVLTYPA